MATPRREPLTRVQAALPAAWYRDPARAAVLTIASAGREGDDTVIRGTQKEDGDPFTVRLSPASGGGTDGRLVFSDAG